MLGLDVDNDSAFINETLLGYCREQKLELTRSRAYKKNDQASIEQKNGAVIRKLVGYGQLEGAAATVVLADLHKVARLYVNFFQPSFKLKSKTRDGARVIKKYHAPATPYEQLLADDRVGNMVKEQLRREFATLDPVQLLNQIRQKQEEIARLASGHQPNNQVKGLCSLINSFGAWQPLGGTVRSVRRTKNDGKMQSPTSGVRVPIPSKRSGPFSSNG